MPQLDHTTYVSQVFWVITAFVVLYMLLVSRYLPRLGSILKAREEILNDFVSLQGSDTKIETGASALERVLDSSKAIHIQLKQGVDSAFRGDSSDSVRLQPLHVIQIGNRAEARAREWAVSHALTVAGGTVAARLRTARGKTQAPKGKNKTK